MGTAGRLVVALVALVVAGILFVVLQQDDGSEATSTAASSASAAENQSSEAGGSPAEKPEAPKPAPKPEPPELATIEIEGGQPVGGVQELSFSEGEAIRFLVESDVADHVHLHGYDVIQDVAVGGSTEFDVPATITGVFEAELEDSAVPIAEITVEPS